MPRARASAPRVYTAGGGVLQAYSRVARCAFMTVPPGVWDCAVCAFRVARASRRRWAGRSPYVHFYICRYRFAPPGVYSQPW